MVDSVSKVMIYCIISVSGVILLSLVSFLREISFAAVALGLLMRARNLHPMFCKAALCMPYILLSTYPKKLIFLDSISLVFYTEFKNDLLLSF